MKLVDEITLNDFREFVLNNKKIEISPEMWEKVTSSNSKLKELMHNGKAHYGINTGFGKLADTIIPDKKINELQKNLIISHAAGVGKDISQPIVKGAMFLRLFCCLKGYSGVRSKVLKLLHSMIENNIIPSVPEKGSVGASGDLAPSAHVALVMLGKGVARVNGTRMEGAEALEKFNLSPVKLQAKEGLSLINGTQFMTSLGAISTMKAKKIIDTADKIAGISIQAIGGRREPYMQKIHKLRPYEGQIKSSKMIYNMLKESRIEVCNRIQDPYSFRCSPQVHGAVREVISFSENIIEKEMNSVTDNPLIIGDEIISGGNFHGEPVAFALDFLKIALSEISSISERRISNLMDPKITNLKAFIAEQPGLNSGFMIPHTTSASLSCRNIDLSFPSVVNNKPTSLNQEDHVSMGMNSGLALEEVIDNTAYVLSIELLSSLQCIRKKGVDKTSTETREFLNPILEIIPPYNSSRIHQNDIEKIKDYLMDES